MTYLDDSKRLQGKKISESAPNNKGEVYTWNPTTQEWESSIAPIDVYSNETLVTNSPFSKLNFKGMVVSESTISGAVDVSLNTAQGFISQISDSSENSTTSSTPQTKLTLTTPNLVNGTYRLDWSCEVYAPGKKTMAILIDLNDTTEINFSSCIIDTYQVTVGFQYRTLSGVNNIKIKYYNINSMSCYIRRARLSVWRIS